MTWYAICGWCKKAAVRVNFGWYCKTPGCGAFEKQINPLFPDGKA